MDTTLWPKIASLPCGELRGFLDVPACAGCESVALESSTGPEFGAGVPPTRPEPA
jgi:hypothetical protein